MNYIFNIFFRSIVDCFIVILERVFLVYFLKWLFGIEKVFLIRCMVFEFKLVDLFI